MFCPCDCPLPYPAWVCYQAPDMGDCPDGAVNTFDLLTLFANWGPCDDVRCLNERGWCCATGDIDRDGIVTVADLLILLGAWGPFDRDEWNATRCQEKPE